jgi:hypothetical protein
MYQSPKIKQLYLLKPLTHTFKRVILQSSGAKTQLTDASGSRQEIEMSTLSKFQVSANGTVFGTYDAATEQEARDLCAQDAGYKSEADMEAQLEQPSELVAEADE